MLVAAQNLLYSVYSVPNTVLPFFGGAFVDRFGINTALALFSSFILLGQVIVASGSSLGSFEIMLVRTKHSVVSEQAVSESMLIVFVAWCLWIQIGRFVIGLGGESLSVAQGALVVEWFKNEEIGTPRMCQL